ncbi:hypothetical protein [Lichenifustis flavocetrariae]|uniref:Uncharacterized protein n=1 Tax=Lichenifustis flavocetrariae TaxID=2949735 RepID=A0AA42CGL0_9HYPH|nr:hypothetical protein [Lichenifustis flavocetrariae]MCW6506693.1 hypothetical protein [Lichenifustis flavocetrariae]
MARGRLVILGFAFGAIGMGVGTSSAAPITYNINQTIGSGSVVGSIGTDGTLGSLGASNVVDWTLTLTSGMASYVLTSSNSAVVGSGADLMATSSQLLFDYSGTDGGYLLFQQGLYSGNHYYCDAAAGNFACSQGATVAPESNSSPSFQNVGLSGNVVIGTAVSSVPLPAALPLFGVAVLTLAGLGYGKSRRKASAVTGAPIA